jgi:MATE family multidrug resistance protein
VTIVGLVDIAMVGRIGPRAQAAVGYASQFFFLAQSALFAIGMACVAVMARAIGSGDRDRARAGLAASLLLAQLTGLVIAGVIAAFPETLLGWLAAEPDVIADAVPYLRLLMASSVLFAAALTLESALRANRDTRTPMQVALVVTTLKVGLNALLIFGLLGFPRLELVGAGIATVASQVVAIALLGSVALRAPRDSPLRLRRRDWTASRGLLGELTRISLPGVVERLVMNMAMLAYFALLGGYGTVAVAAYTIGVRVLAFSWIPGVGYAQAVATIVGQALGADDKAGAQRAGNRAGRLALGTAVTLGVVCAVAREPLARLFTNDAATIATLGPFMLCLAVAQPFLQFHFTLGGAHRGAGDTWTPLVAAFIGNWIFRVPLAFLFARVLEWPLAWVWSALILDHIARAAWLFVSFRRGHWTQGMRRRRD